MLINTFYVGQRVRLLFDGQEGTVESIAESANGLTYRVDRPNAKPNERFVYALETGLEAVPASSEILGGEHGN